MKTKKGAAHWHRTPFGKLRRKPGDPGFTLSRQLDA